MKKFFEDYLWNGEELVRRLQLNELSDNVQFIYFLLFVNFTKIASMFLSDDQQFLWGIRVDYLEFLFILMGTCLCYAFHRRIDGREFLKKFICLSVPAFIRSLTLIFIPLFVVYSLSIALLGEAFALMVVRFHIGGAISALSAVYFYFYLARVLGRKHTAS